MACMLELPCETVTLLLTDVEGSSALWEGVPEPMRRAIAAAPLPYRQ